VDDQLKKKDLCQAETYGASLLQCFSPSLLCVVSQAQPITGKQQAAEDTTWAKPVEWKQQV